MSSLRYFAWISVGLVSLACGSDEEAPRTAAPDAGSAIVGQPFEGCVRDELESDLQTMPFAGPGVRDGAIVPGEYMIAATYLQLRPEVQERFDTLVGPVVGDIMTRQGLVAVAFATSQECGSARTISVWRDEMAMLDFVVGDAHAKAMSAIGELSRGGSVAAQWLGGRDTATWDSAAEQLATSDRQEY